MTFDRFFMAKMAEGTRSSAVLLLKSRICFGTQIGSLQTETETIGGLARTKSKDLSGGYFLQLACHCEHGETADGSAEGIICDALRETRPAESEDTLRTAP